MQVDFALREVVLEQTEKLDGVRTMDQVWTYLIGEAGAERKDAGLMAKLFQEQWYNGAQIGISGRKTGGKGNLRCIALVCLLQPPLYCASVPFVTSAALR